MRFVIHILATSIFCLLLQIFLPWWSIAVGAFLVSYFMRNKALSSFLAGCIGVALLWSIAALFIDITTQSVLTEKINRLLPVNALFLTALVGGLVGGFASLTGALARLK